MIDYIPTALLRIARIFRFNGLIASFSSTLQRCGKVIARTWKPVSMLYLFLALFIWVYAMIGMVLYKKTEIEFGSVDIINFNTFGQSLILLIQVRIPQNTETKRGIIFQNYVLSRLVLHPVGTVCWNKYLKKIEVSLPCIYFRSYIFRSPFF